jgi:rhodanese-related sulfurtransferase
MADDIESSPIEIHCRRVHEKLVAGAELLLLDCREPKEYELVHANASQEVQRLSVRKCSAWG